MVSDSPSPSLITPKPKGIYRKRKKGYAQAVELQDLIMETCRNGGAKPAELAQLARAWSDLENRKRELRGKPLPKAVDAERLMKKKGRQTSFSGSFDESASPDPEPPTGQKVD